MPILNLKRFEVEYNDEGQIIKEGIFASYKTSKNCVIGTKNRELVDKVWNELHSPHYEINSHRNDVIFFFKENAFTKWNLYSFAEALFKTIDEEIEAKNLVVAGKLRIKKSAIVYEDDHQVAIDRDYYKQMLEKRINFEYL